MVLADSPYLNATSIQDFSGAAVLGQQGTALDDVIEQIEGVDHLSPVGSVPDMISRLQQGTCDAIVINVENAQGYLASNPNFRLVTFDEGSGFTLPGQGLLRGSAQERHRTSRPGQQHPFRHRRRRPRRHVAGAVDGQPSNIHCRRVFTRRRVREAL